MVVAFPRLLMLAARIDARRGASWLAAVTSAVGLLLLESASTSLLIPLAWAHGAVVAVIAAGAPPDGLVGRVGFRRDVLVGLSWAVERVAWPLIGVAAVLAAGGPASGLPVAVMAAAATAMLLWGCRRLGSSAADAASGVLGVTLIGAMMAASDSLRAWPPLPAAAGSWSVLAVGLLGLVSRADGRDRLPRETTAAGGPLGDSELRRWYLMLMMAGTMLGMVRWLFDPEPLVGRYGVASGFLVASCVVPDAMLVAAGASSASWRHVASVAGRRQPSWQQLQTWLLPAAVAVWPLLVAVVLVPASRGMPAVLTVGAVAAGLAVAAMGRLAVTRRGIAAETAFAVTVSLIWLACLAGLAGGGYGQPPTAR